MIMNRHKEKTIYSALLLIIILILLITAIVGLLLLRPAHTMLQGQVEADQIRISGILGGRVMQLMVEEGEKVMAGDTLVHIHSSLVEAQLTSASALRKVAQAENELVDAGTRKEVVQSAYDLLLQAQAALSVAEKSYKRVHTLYDKGVVSAQKYDETLAAYEMAQAAESAARSQYEMARNGARYEERSASQAMLQAADGGVAEVESLLEDALLTSPRSGIVSEIFPQEGELVTLGAPIMNILLLDEIWVSFNVREELLQHLTLGSCHETVIPALGGEKVMMRVFYIKDMGTYAVWRATRVGSGYDARTFNVRMRPEHPIEGLLPGMSVLLDGVAL